MDESILYTIKQMLGLEVDYTPFDVELIAYINSAIMTLTQLGIGLNKDFLVTGDTETWADFVGDRTDESAIQNYILVSVKPLFDSTLSGTAVESCNKMRDELAWRLKVRSERED